MSHMHALPGRRRNIVELICVVLTGVCHIMLELSCDGMKGAASGLNRPQHYFNLAAGVLHGILGATAYYFVLGQDPGLQLLTGLEKMGF